MAPVGFELTTLELGPRKAVSFLWMAYEQK
jgi:hypothetical protein